MAIRSSGATLGLAHSVTPLLMIVSEAADRITPTDIALRAYAAAGAPKKRVTIALDHYRPYVEAFDQSSAAARDWFVEHL